MATKTREHEKIPHPATLALDLAAILKVVGDPVRLEIVRMLADDSSLICNQIQDALEIQVSKGY